MITRQLSSFLPGVLWLACLSGPALADTPAAPDATTWKANANIGYIGTNGTSSRTQALQTAFHGECLERGWTNQIDGLLLSAKDLMARTRTERYLMQTKSSKDFTTMNYAYLSAQWENDSTSIYNFQANLNTGYGHYFIKDDHEHLSLELGAGERHSEPVNAAPVNDLIGKASLHYRRQLNDLVKFTQRASIESGRVDRVVRSFSELKTSISKKMAAAVSYDFKSDDANGGTRAGITGFSLSYQFD